MDKILDVGSFNHVVKLNERKNIVLSGVKKIINFDDKEFSLDTTMGVMLIKGEELEMIKLDTLEGNVSIKGSVDSFSYVSILAILVPLSICPRNDGEISSCSDSCSCVIFIFFLSLRTRLPSAI